MSELERTAPAEMLAEMATLRRRARADRHGYWFPLVVFGLVIVGATPLYIEPDFGPVPDEAAYYWAPGDGAGWYWLATLIISGLLTVWWYRWRGRRIGPQSAGTVAVVAAALGVAAAAAMATASMLGFTGFLALFTPLSRGYGATLVIAAGLIGLAWVERSLVLAAIVAVYTAAAVLANFYNVENVLFELGWDATLGSGGLRLIALPNLLLPGFVLLLAGGATGAARLLRRRG